MERILALDLGDERIGVALSDSLGLSARGLCTLRRSDGGAEKKIISLIKQYDIKHLVLGLPLDEQGRETKQCLKIRNFGRRLLKRLDVSIHYVDEFGSSQAAKDILNLPRNPSIEHRKRGLIDSASAAIILQDYLESRKAKPDLQINKRDGGKNKQKV